MNTIKVEIKKEDQEKIPTYAHEADSGVDLYSAEDCTIMPGERKLVRTGIRMAIPKGYEGQVRPKSGLALKHGITVLNTPGTVDAPYRGEVGVILLNTDTEKPYHVEVGSKIAQMVFCEVAKAEFILVEELDKTTRGEGGFGSTGTK